MKKWVAAAVVTALTLLFPWTVHTQTPPAAARDTAAAMSTRQAGSYQAYRGAHADAARPAGEVTVRCAEAFAVSDGMQTAQVDGTLVTGDAGRVTWTVTVPQSGLYNIRVRYKPVVDIAGFIGKSASAERALLIDGEVPFDGASVLAFSRIWTDDINYADGFEEDAGGNQVRPRQQEAPDFTETYLSDRDGYTAEPYAFYLEAGEHTVAFESIREPLQLDRLVLDQAPSLPSYDPVTPGASQSPIVIQGEQPARKSDQMLFAKYDRSSPLLQPVDVSKIMLNFIGGENWKEPGQWLEWDFEVESGGVYAVDVKFRQNYNRGMLSYRKVTLIGADGRVYGCRETEDQRFSFSDNWQAKRLSTPDGEPILFELPAGRYTLRMENVLGDVAPVVQSAENSVYTLNEVYRKILMITGRTPDSYRDYKLVKQFPELGAIFEEQSKLLYGILEDMRGLTGQKAAANAAVEKLAYQLDTLAGDPERITKNNHFDNFKTNIGALSSWLYTVKEQPLDIDYIAVQTPDHPLPEVKTGLWNRFVFWLKGFVLSFFTDYSVLGAQGEDRVITVWVGTGRDQASVIKSMIDDDFTKKTGIGVNLRLIDPTSVLMQAFVAGKAPDVAMGIAKNTPVNYAIRGAVSDLSGFEGFDEVAGRFRESAMLSYRFDGATYALPETETFYMMFYRKDILAQLGLSVPDTWDDVYDMIPVLQRHNLEFALPDPNATAGDAAISMFLYQMGGAIYTEDGTRSALDSDSAIRAFTMWTDFYTSYKLPSSYDPPSRFRRGEIPVMIADYTLYNTLNVSAPEIRGLWGFAPIPGTPTDGSVDRSVSNSSSCIMMTEQAANPEAAWEFMKWWTDTPAQIRFGREMESILGPSARHPTANIEALASLPWPTADYNNLLEQGRSVKGIPEVPGGYFTARHIENAFRRVAFTGENPRDTMNDYVKYINEELEIKRRELGI